MVSTSKLRGGLISSIVFFDCSLASLGLNRNHLSRFESSMGQFSISLSGRF
jgi:hypothetical protein